MVQLGTSPSGSRSFCSLMQARPHGQHRFPAVVTPFESALLPWAQLGTHLRGKRKREELSGLLRKAKK